MADRALFRPGWVLHRFYPWTFSELNDMADILGATASSFWPFLETAGLVIRSYGQSVKTLVPSDAGGAVDISAEFEPFKHQGGLHSFYIVNASNNHLAGVDHADYTFGDAAVDAPFSVGLWVLPTDTGAVRALLAKYNAVGTLREWLFRVNADGTLGMELYDESEDATEIATGATALTVNRWAFVVMTYDGNEDTPVVNLYVNAVLDNDGTTVEAGAYAAMENTATPLLVGASGVTAAPTNEFEGRIALPFICGQALAAQDVIDLYNFGRRLLGIE